MTEIKIACKGHSTALLDELVEFQGNLKTLSDINYKKLRKQILDLGFSEPFSVWPNSGVKNLLNGHQRKRTLTRMRDEEGYIIPPLPINIVEAKNLKEAKKKVLSLTSQYGEMTSQSLQEFIEANDLSMPEIEDFRFPELNIKDLTLIQKSDLANLDEKKVNDAEKKFILEVEFPNDMEMMDHYDDLINQGYIVRIK